MPPRKKPRNEIAHPRPCREAANQSSIQSIDPTRPVDWTPPVYLRDRALAEWHRIVRHLDEHGIGRAADRTVVEAAARLWSMYTRAMDAIEADGFGAQVKRREVLKHASPAVRVALDTIAQLRQIWGALGMTPDSRYRIRAQSDDDKNKIVSDWLYGSEQDRPLRDNEDY